VNHVPPHYRNGQYVRGHYRTSSRVRARTARITGLASVLTMVLVLVIPTITGFFFGLRSGLTISLISSVVAILGVVVTLSSGLARFMIRETIRRPGVDSEIEVVPPESGERP
jgi:hypothetical protein